MNLEVVLRCCCCYCWTMEIVAYCVQLTMMMVKITTPYRRFSFFFFWKNTRLTLFSLKFFVTGFPSFVFSQLAYATLSLWCFFFIISLCPRSYSFSHWNLIFKSKLIYTDQHSHICITYIHARKRTVSRCLRNEEKQKEKEIWFYVCVTFFLSSYSHVTYFYDNIAIVQILIIFCLLRIAICVIISIYKKRSVFVCVRV